jgi:hypothetical protein
MGTTDPLAVLEQVGLERGDQRRVLGGNAARLFRIR